MIELLMITTPWAQDIPGEELYTAPTEPRILSPVQNPQTKQKQNQSSSSQSQKNLRGTTDSNLPSIYSIGSHRESTASELIQPPKGSSELLRVIKVGETIEVEVQHSIIAFPDEKAPVIATSNQGKYRNLKFIGESILEKNTKRIFINFTRVAVGDQIYNLKASGLTDEGQPGITGEYHSREAEYFAGDFISSFVAGYFDGLIPRQTNPYGQVIQDNSIDSATKKGLSSGALSSAERFREKLKKVPEFSELKGPFNLKLLILEQAKSTN